MPLYDGGANKAQRGEVGSRRTSLEHKRLAFIRDHESESSYLRRQLMEYTTRQKLQKQQLTRMTAQLQSLQAVQGDRSPILWRLPACRPAMPGCRPTSFF